MSEQDSLHDGLPIRQRIPAIIAVLLCIAMAAINVSLINIALPTIASELQIDAHKIIYVVSAYQLTLLLLLLTVSSLGDYLGHKRITLAGIAVFTIASLGCAFSQSLTALVIWRIIQGLGATALMGTYFSLMALIYPKKQLGRGMGLSTTVSLLVAVSGPPLGGLILSVASWHWLFLINVPLGILVLILGGRYFPANTVKVPKCPIAFGDVALHIIVFGLFFFAASGWSHQPQQWIENTTLSLFCIAVAFIYVRRQLGKQTPFLPIDLLRQGTLGLPILISVLNFSAMLTTIVAVPFIFQGRFEYSVTQTGLFLMVITGASIISSMIAGYCIERTKPIYLSGAGFTAWVISACSFAFLPEEVSTFDLIWRLALFGIGSGLIQPANNFMAINAAPADRKGAANGLLTTSMMFGQIIGMILVKAVFSLSGSETTLFPLYLSGMIAAIAVGVIASRLKI